ncbi:inorganic phosphate transporter, partial [bacterium]|nr:inorganic phosphate transporter [bacterium]
VVTYKEALYWASITTFLGSMASMYLAEELVKNFSGKGLLPIEIISNPAFLSAVAIGAALTVLLATLLAIPISTTHSLVGSLVGAGLVFASDQLQIMQLGKTFFWPLLISPFMAAFLTYILYYLFNRSRKILKFSKDTHLYIEKRWVIANNNQTSLARSDLTEILTIGTPSKELYTDTILGISLQNILNKCHFLSSGIVCFARGLNDTPKMIGLLVSLQVFGLQVNMSIIALMILIGGIIHSKKLAKSLSKDITTMNDGQGFSANLITGLLVCTASLHGMPVSTTHVSVGSIIGLGLHSKQSKKNKSKIQSILLAWILTLPLGICLSALTALLIQV